MDNVESRSSSGAYHFDAFLSYATRADYHLVRRLKIFLETVHHLKGASDLPLAKLAVCTDEVDFSLRAVDESGDMESLLDNYLSQSRFLVVLCSPEAAASPWVDYEVKWFIERRGANAVLLAVTKGDPVRDPRSVFPASVINAKLHEGRSWYDFRGATRATRRIVPIDVVRDFEEQRLRLAADLLGRSSSELQPLWYRDQRRQQRRRIAILSLTAGALAVLAFIAVYAWRIAIRQRELAESREQTAMSRRLALQSLAQIDVQPEQALLLAIASRQLTPTPESESALLAALTERPRLYRMLHRDGSMVLCVASSPDGRRIAAGTFDGRVLQFDRRSGHMFGRPLAGHRDAVSNVVFASDDTLVSGGADGRVIVWNATTGEKRTSFDGPLTADGVESLAVARDGRLLATGTRDGKIVLWSLPDLRPLGSPLLADGVMLVAFHPASEVLISVSMDDGIRFWDVASHRAIRRLPVHKSTGNFALAVAPNGRYLAVSGETGTLELWSLHAANPTRSILRGHRGDIASLAFSPDSRTLAAGDERSISLWDTATRKKTSADDLGHSNVVQGLGFTADGELLISSSSDGSVCLWKMKDADALGERLVMYQGEATAVAFAPDGRYVASGGVDGSVRVWSLPSARGVRMMKVPKPVRELAFSHDGKLLAETGDGEMHVWLTTSGVSAGELQWENARRVAFSRDDGTIAVGRTDGAVTLWDVAGRRTRPLVEREDGEFSSNLIFSPDGTQLVEAVISSFGVHEIPVYAVHSGALIGGFSISSSRDVSSLAISNDGSLLASGGTGPMIELWDFKSRKMIRQLPGLKTNVYGLAFGPHRRLVSAANEGVWLWDADGGTQIGRRLFKGLTQSVAYSPTGTHVAAANADGSVWIWDLSPEVWRRVACRIANRNLTPVEWQTYLGDRPYTPQCLQEMFVAH